MMVLLVPSLIATAEPRRVWLIETMGAGLAVCGTTSYAAVRPSLVRTVTCARGPSIDVAYSVPPTVSSVVSAWAAPAACEHGDGEQGLHGILHSGRALVRAVEVKNAVSFPARRTGSHWNART
jgi:hypothetical protein